MLDYALLQQLAGEQLTATVIDPDQAKQVIPLERDPGAQPFYQGVFPTRRSGAHLVDARHSLSTSDTEAKSLFALTRREDKPNAWRLTYLGQGKARDLFAETPEPLFLDSARSADGEGFDLTLVSSCCGAAKPRQSGVAATLTIMTDVGAFEMQAVLE